MATGCVKIVKSAKEFDPSTGKFIPEEKRAKSVDLFKGRRLFYFETVMSKTLKEGFVEKCSNMLMRVRGILGGVSCAKCNCTLQKAFKSLSFIFIHEFVL